MRKQISAILASAIVLSASLTAQVGAIDLNRPGDDYEHEHEKIQKYTCPMHPEVITDHPGNCPKCGMKLVPLKEKKPGTSNVQHSTSKVGAIDPNRPGHTHEHKKMQMEMHSSIDLAEPMRRDGSGT